MVNAAELLARVRQRKQELKTWEWWDTTPSTKVYHPNTDPGSTASTDAQPELHLTKWELKRQRKLDRESAREDKRQRIVLGIDEPPAPKLKLSNVAAVYGPAFVQDPTKYELEARQAEEDRRNEHLRANAERQLTKEQRWEKHVAKVQANRDSGIHCAAFHFAEPLSSKAQYIVDYTAKKFLCTGVCMLGDNDAFLVIESGEPESEKFIKLVTLKLGGRLVWKGLLKTSNFKRWSVHSTPKREEFLKVYGVDSIYEQALAAQP